MAKQQSSIDRLPEDIRKAFFDMLRDPRLTQLEIVDIINEMLAEAEYPDRITKSSANRAAVSERKLRESLQQSREIAKIMVGTDAFKEQSETSKLLSMIVQTLAFNTGSALLEEGGAVDPAMLRSLSLSVYQLEKAASENMKRDDEIREHERKKLKEQTLAAVDSAEKSGQPMTAERFKQIVRESYGV